MRNRTAKSDLGSPRTGKNNERDVELRRAVAAVTNKYGRDAWHRVGSDADVFADAFLNEQTLLPRW